MGASDAFIKSFYAKYSELFSKECKMADTVQ